MRHVIVTAQIGIGVNRLHDMHGQIHFLNALLADLAAGAIGNERGDNGHVILDGKGIRAVLIHARLFVIPPHCLLGIDDHEILVLQIPVHRRHKAAHGCRVVRKRQHTACAHALTKRALHIVKGGGNRIDLALELAKGMLQGKAIELIDVVAGNDRALDALGVFYAVYLGLDHIAQYLAAERLDHELIAKCRYDLVKSLADIGEILGYGLYDAVVHGVNVAIKFARKLIFFYIRQNLRSGICIHHEKSPSFCKIATLDRNPGVSALLGEQRATHDGNITHVVNGMCEN